ncbi:outer membrane lipoprotein carrier protein LolA [bacterium]|nr:outer membrane lipoprotein carrier protein LolA [bacterium]
MKRFFILTLLVMTAFAAENETKSEEVKTPPAEIKLKQENSPAKSEAAKSAPKIDKALEELGVKIKDLKTFTADFTQLDIDPLFMDESTHKGKLSFLRAVMEGKTNCFLRFDYTEPEKSVTILTPLGILIYTDDMTEPQISPARDGNSADIIFSTFVSPAALKRHYEVLPGKSQKAYSFKLVPKSPFAKSFFTEAEVDFSEKTGLPERLRQIKINGQDITINFTNAELNAQLPVDNFDAASLKKKP